jgi:hypothetical protein
VPSRRSIRTRRAGIRLGKSAPLFAEYDYANGPILVRVSKLLTPDQAKEYEAATKTITG